MRDMGIIQGSAAQAVPLIIGVDTVYVHTDIELLPPNEEHGAEMYQYREVQYSLHEYMQMTLDDSADMAEALNIILGGEANA